MNCLPLARRFKSIGRILRKMLPTFKKQSSYERLSSNDDKENRPIDFTLPYSPSSSSTSSCSWDRSWPSTPSFHLLRETYALTPKTYLNNRSDGSGWESPCSTGYGSDSIWSSPQSSAINFDIFKDSANSSSNSLLKPLPIPSPVDDAYSSRSTVYSSLSSSSFTASTSFADFGSDDFIDNLTPLLNDTHDEVRRDFENNGKTTEYIENEYFVPSVSSTPMAHRKPRYFHTNMHRQQTMELRQQTFVYPKPQTQVEFERPYPQMGRKFKPHKKSLGDHCVFCKNNGESDDVCRSHRVKDAYGRVVCPVLRLYKCPICNQSGDKSHTVKYCPKKRIITEEDIKQISCQ